MKGLLNQLGFIGIGLNIFSRGRSSGSGGGSEDLVTDSGEAIVTDSGEQIVT